VARCCALARARRQPSLNLRAYLESSNVHNLPLDQRHGFIVGEHHLPRGPTMTFMRLAPIAGQGTRTTRAAL
jgi:hypothetical protein